MFAADQTCVGAQTNRDIATQRAVFGLVARIRRNVAADTGPVGRWCKRLFTSPNGTRWWSTVYVTRCLKAHPTADFEAHVCAGDVIEPHAVQATNLHVLDRRGLDGKIGCLRPSYCNEPRCRAEEKTFV